MIAFRHHELARPSWWRCIVQSLGWGTVTGYIELGTVVTTWHVQLDTGASTHAYPAAVAPATSDAPPPLRVVQGGRR